MSDEEIFCIYGFTDPTSSNPYFYFGKGLFGRPYEHLHLCMLRHNPLYKLPFYRKLREMKVMQIEPIIEIVNDYLTEFDAFELERYYIQKYGRIDLGTGCLLNLTDGGEGHFGRIWTPEMRENARLKAIKRGISAETREKNERRLIMEPLNIKRKKIESEKEIELGIMNYLKIRDWFVIKLHGNIYQMGMPDLFCAHYTRGTRLIEVKHPDHYSFTPAQLEVFPQLQSKSVGIWILTAYDEYEMKKLDLPPNWYTFLGKSHMSRDGT